MRQALTTVFILSLVIGFQAAPAFADSLMYMDDAGNLNFVENPSQIPPQYRYQLTPKPKKVYVDEKTRKKMIKDAETQKKKHDAEEKKRKKEEEREKRLEEKKERNAEKVRERKEREKEGGLIPPPPPRSTNIPTKS